MKCWIAIQKGKKINVTTISHACLISSKLAAKTLLLRLSKVVAALQTRLKSKVLRADQIRHLQKLASVLENNPPQIVGNETFRATIYVGSVYRFSVTDVGDNFTVAIKRTPSLALNDFMLENDGSEYNLVWTPRGTSAVSFAIIANDSRGAVSEHEPLVRLCGCALQNGAECVEVDTDGGQDGFILEDCECGPGL